MPVDRNKMLRYKVLDECFRDTSKLYKIGDLLECCNREMDRLDLKHVSRRTVQQDIQTLQMEPCNVEFDSGLRKLNYYRYADVTATLSVLSITTPDRDALARTITLLRERYSDADEQNPQWQWMLATLESIAGDRPMGEGEYVSFENNSAFAGNAYFATLLEAIMNRHPVSVRYRPYNAEASEMKIYPYYLKQFNSRWFLLCAEEGKTGIINLALDRILKVKPWKHPYKEPEVDFTTWFDDMIGVSRSEKLPVEPVTLKVANSRYPYVETKPFSEKQRILRHDEQTHTITFPIRVNNELVAEILSFGSDVEVLHPQHLRDKIGGIIKQMEKNYSEKVPNKLMNK